MLYNYRYSNTYHIVKADYNESNGSSYSLNEQYHQTINANTYFGSASSLGENYDTIWHAVSFQTSAIYFQYNLTDFSLIGNKYLSSNGITYVIERWK